MVKRKRKVLKKPKKTLAKLKKELWELCKKITRERYKDCYTCPKKNLTGWDAHTGHGKPKGALSLKYQYDLRNLRLQCMHDNINLGGCTDIFIAKLEKEKEGLEFLNEACIKIDGKWEIKYEPPMGSIQAWEFVNNKIKEYETKLLDNYRLSTNKNK